MRAVIRQPRRHSTRAQALVEFGLVGLVLLALVAGIGQLGMILYANVTISSAARDGARIAAEMPIKSAAFSSTGAPELSGNPVDCSGAQSTGGAGAENPNPICVAVTNSSGIFAATGNTTETGCPASAGSGCTSIIGAPWLASCTTYCVTPTCPADSVPDGLVQVTVEYRVPVIVPLLSNILADPGTNYRTVTSTVLERVDPCTMTKGS